MVAGPRPKADKIFYPRDEMMGERPGEEGKKPDSLSLSLVNFNFLKRSFIAAAIINPLFSKHQFQFPITKDDRVVEEEGKIKSSKNSFFLLRWRRKRRIG